MDIAEIRKKAKAKGKTEGSGGVQPPLPSPPAVPSGPAAPAAPVPEAAAAVQAPLPDAAVPAALASAGLDRLFSGAGALQFATEEAYQTTLTSQEGQEDAGVAQYLAFQLGSEEYALDITRISEIIKPREYTDIPRVPDFLLGLISLRGVVVPIFDLRRRFRLGKTEIGPATRIVVSREGDVMAGLMVDSINQVISLATDRIEPPPAVLSGVDRSLVAGVGRALI
ncbi:MAG: hypothetical protein FDZ69_13535, partial [Deltaproteobacteria bacterium]